MPPQTIVNLQILRFVAAGCVLFTHVADPIVGQTSAAFRFPWSSSVELFFMISGFIMAWLSQGQHAAPGFAGDFLARRIIRVVPAYWFFTSAAAVALVAIPASSAHTDFAWGHLLASYIFWPTMRPGDGQVVPILPQGWTLNYEAFFYLAWAGSLLVRRGRVMLITGFVGLVAIHAFVPAHLTALNFFTDPIILEFLIGVGIATLYVRGTRLPWWAAGIGIAMAIVLLLAIPDIWPHKTPRLFVFGIPAALLMASVILGPEAPRRGRIVVLLVLLGDASYMLYLSHSFVAAIVQRLHIAAGWGEVGLICVLAILLSVMLHRVVERPLTELLRRRMLSTT